MTGWAGYIESGQMRNHMACPKGADLSLAIFSRNATSYLYQAVKGYTLRKNRLTRGMLTAGGKVQVKVDHTS